MKLSNYFFIIFLFGSYRLVHNWDKNGEYEYYFDGQVVNGYDEAVTKCAEQNATLIIIKKNETQEFLRAQNWIGKHFLN